MTTSAVPARLVDVEALLLDMDGTIVDSTPAVERVWSAFAIDHGLDVGAVLAGCHGRTASATITEHLPDADPQHVARLAALHVERELADLDGVTPIDGAPDLLAACADAGVPWAVVTNCPRDLAHARLAAAGIEPPVLVTADDVEHAKPDPQGFLAAARTLGAEPARCLVLEDSDSGLAAARAAGMPVLRVGPHGEALHVVVDRLVGARRS